MLSEVLDFDHFSFLHSLTSPSQIPPKLNPWNWNIFILRVFLWPKAGIASVAHLVKHARSCKCWESWWMKRRGEQSSKLKTSKQHLPPSRWHGWSGSTSYCVPCYMSEQWTKWRGSWLPCQQMLWMIKVYLSLRGTGEVHRREIA